MSIGYVYTLGPWRPPCAPLDIGAGEGAVLLPAPLETAGAPPPPWVVLKAVVECGCRIIVVVVPP